MLRHASELSNTKRSGLLQRLITQRPAPFSALTLLCVACAHLAAAQSSSFAFGQGGFLDDDGPSAGLFNECEGQLEGHGEVTCDGFTVLMLGQGETESDVRTLIDTDDIPDQNSALARAMATYSLSGNGSTASLCSLVQSSGNTGCRTGAYASSQGAFAATQIGSKR